MKKTIAVLLIALVAVCSVFATAAAEKADVKGEGVMTYAEYAAADLDSEVVIEAYVQAHQSWWKDQLTIYLQDKDGGYLAYNCACDQATADKLVPGTKVKISGYKSEWAGEVEVVDGTLEILEGSWIAKAEDVTSLLGTDKLVEKINRKVAFKGLKVSQAPTYNWDGSGSKGDDVYFYVSNGTEEFQFLIESYLCGADTDVYKAAEALKVGDTVDFEGFLYWYNGPNPHITSITVK